MFLFRAILIVGFIQFCYFSHVFASENRISTTNQFVWVSNTITYSTKNHYSVWVEYQWRRTDYLENWQQSLFRAGIQRSLMDNKIEIGGGYAWVETFPYGKYANKLNKPFPEHRIFQQLILNDDIYRLKLNSRFRYEQRILGLLQQDLIGANTRKIKEWNLMHRIRHQIRFTYPINKPQINTGTFYANLYNEIFIGFGKNINNNIFDQNRTGIMAGYVLNNNLRVETGIFHLILQQPTLVNGKSVIQYNNGFLLSVISAI